MGMDLAGEGRLEDCRTGTRDEGDAQGLPGGTSFMEDYTYDFNGTPKVLGSHMLEICPSIAADKPSLEVHPLGIGGKADPVAPRVLRRRAGRQLWPRWWIWERSFG